MKMDRAYSLLDIKAIDEEKRIIEGIATTPSVDRVGDVVEPKGAEFSLPIPFLWQHDYTQPIGHVIKAEVTRGGIRIRAQLAKVDTRSQLGARLDEAWETIKLGLVRGLSIGFRAVERERIEDDDGHFVGVRFVRWMWLELSAVTIPANQDATITALKAIDVAQRAASGRKAVNDRPGVSGFPKEVSTERKGTREMKTIQEQIEALEAKRAAKAARMEAISSKAAEEDRQMDDAEGDEFDELVLELDDIDRDLKRLNALDRARKSAKPAEGKTERKANESRTPGLVVVKDSAPKGINFARFVMCLAAAKGNHMQALEIAKSRYPSNDPLQNILKTAVVAGTTTDPTWAAPLVDYQNFAGDFIEYLRPLTIVGKFGSDGVPALRQVPFNIKVPAQTSGGSAGWVGEGRAKGVTRADFSSVTLRWNKLAAISVLTDELVRFATPSAEMLVRNMLAEAIVETIDADFVDVANSGNGDIKPASITNGASTSASSGDTADDVREDVKTAFSHFITNKISLSTGVWVMEQSTALALMLMRNELGQAEFPGITMTGGTFMGLPVITSQHVGSGVVVLCNASDIYLADDGQVTIDISREATVAMNDAPAGVANADDSPPTVTGLGGGSEGADLVSLWQQNAIGIRAERYITWKRRRAAAVYYLSSVSWGTPASP